MASQLTLKGPGHACSAGSARSPPAPALPAPPTPPLALPLDPHASMDMASQLT